MDLGLFCKTTLVVVGCQLYDCSIEPLCVLTTLQCPEIQMSDVSQNTPALNFLLFPDRRILAWYWIICAYL
jgi:hypothetical protein